VRPCAGPVVGAARAAQTSDMHGNLSANHACFVGSPRLEIFIRPGLDAPQKLEFFHSLHRINP
jgi:hypothetical protein